MRRILWPGLAAVGAHVVVDVNLRDAPASGFREGKAVLALAADA